MTIYKIKPLLFKAFFLIFGTLGLCAIPFALFILVVTYNHKAEINVFALVAIIASCIALFICKRSYEKFLFK